MIATGPSTKAPSATTAGRSNPFYSAEHEAWRTTLRRWVAREIEPHVDAWERERTFPRDLYRKAADVGLLGIGFPEEYGGTPGDIFMQTVSVEELCRPAAGGVYASLMSHGIGAPPIAVHGSSELKARVLPQILAGEKISALAITEPSGGSDVARLQTSAVRDGDQYVVNGSKTFITSGMRADYHTVAVRTGGPGLSGISLLLVESDAPGFSRTPIEKMGWHSSDTATLHFDDMRVPVANRIGAENAGFAAIMHNFNGERMGLATQAIATAQAALDEAIDYARVRETFGKPLISNQVIRHKIVEMTRLINAARAYRDQLAWRITAGESPVADVCMLKVTATTTLEFCAREAAQILGGASYTLGTKTERIYREVRVLAIGGGSEEIMRDLAARQMGL
jgi:acyl-CoA dehydrogenase